MKLAIRITLALVFLLPCLVSCSPLRLIPQLLDLALHPHGASHDTPPPPAQIRDLHAQAGTHDGEILLVWTAPAGYGNREGVASYELRLSGAPLTEENFEAGDIYPHAWIPLAPGEKETRVIEGLVPGGYYFIALRAWDHSSMPGPVATTSCQAFPEEDPPPEPADVTPPAPVANLEARPGSSSGEIELRWTAPGDDGIVGDAAAYELRVSSFPFTASETASAPVYVQDWAPLPAGSEEVRVLSGLDPGTFYSIAVMAVDEVGNLSSPVLASATGALLPAEACWAPLLQLGNSLNGIWGSAWNDVFVVGDSGAVLHFDGLTWSVMGVPVASDLNAVWGSAWNDVFAVGDGGAVLHFDGTAWSVSAPVTSSDLLAVCGTGPGEVWAVGAGGTVLRFDGSAWASVDAGTTAELRGVWCAPGSAVTAVGAGGTVVRFDGNAWSVSTCGVSLRLDAVWGRSGNEVWAAGENGSIFRWDGSSWLVTVVQMSGSLHAVGGAGPESVLAAGDGGTVLRSNGATWSGFTPEGYSESWSGVWGSAVADAFTVGASGTVLRFAHPGLWSFTVSELTLLEANPDKEIRLAAFRERGRRGGTDAVPPLIRALTETDGHVRETAFASLVLVGGRDAAQRLRAIVWGTGGGEIELLRNGDFSSGLDEWTVIHGSNISDSWNVTVEGADAHARWYRIAGADGGHVGVRQAMDVDVSGSSSLVLRARVKVVRHDLGSSGWWSDAYGGSGEYPVKLQIRYRDANDAGHVWTHGFLAGSNSCFLENYSEAPSGTWVDFEVELTDANNRLKPDPARRSPDPSLPPIHTVKFFDLIGCGWSFEGHGDNVSLRTGSPLFLLQGSDAVPGLIDAVGDWDPWLARFANEALRVLTDQDFGDVPFDLAGRTSLEEAWQAWWDGQ